MLAVSEAEACRWLGLCVRIVTSAGGPGVTGRLRHVSSRNVFVLEEDHAVPPFGGVIRSIPLAGIVRIEPAREREATP
jgi:hypothetical protein